MLTPPPPPHTQNQPCRQSDKRDSTHASTSATHTLHHHHHLLLHLFFFTRKVCGERWRALVNFCFPLCCLVRTQTRPWRAATGSPAASAKPSSSENKVRKLTRCAAAVFWFLLAFRMPGSFVSPSPHPDHISPFRLDLKTCVQFVLVDAYIVIWPGEESLLVLCCCVFVFFLMKFRSIWVITVIVLNDMPLCKKCAKNFNVKHIKGERCLSAS